MIDRQLEHLYPEFRTKVAAIMDGWQTWCDKSFPGWAPFLSEGFRTTARQQELYAQGRTKPGEIVTQKNGTTNPSNHQTCLAVDLVLAHNGIPSWDLPNRAWLYLGHLAREQGLTWGGDWTSLKDYPHVEWPVDDKATYRKAAEWKKAQGLK